MGIEALNDNVVHQICSGQVVVDLATAIKELVENSIDAEATTIDVRLKDYGLQSIQVSDNGSGIDERDYNVLSLKHHTSKINQFQDVDSVDTFGFRGEALSSLCAVGKLSVITCTKQNAPRGIKLEYNQAGSLKQDRETVAAQPGTTITVQDLFYSLPVRQREFKKNAKRELTKAVNILQAYGIISRNIRISCSNQIGKGSRSVLLQTNGNDSIRANVTNIFGPRASSELVEFDTKLDICETSNSVKPVDIQVDIKGFVSKPTYGSGRPHGDRQFLFVNSRPCVIPRITRSINEAYRMYNMHQFPFVIVNICMTKGTFDLNVSPDKRSIFLHDEDTLINAIKKAFCDIFEPYRGDMGQNANNLVMPRLSIESVGSPEFHNRITLRSESSDDSQCVSVDVESIDNDIVPRNEDLRFISVPTSPETSPNSDGANVCNELSDGSDRTPRNSIMQPVSQVKEKQESSNYEEGEVELLIKDLNEQELNSLTSDEPPNKRLKITETEKIREVTPRSSKSQLSREYSSESISSVAINRQLPSFKHRPLVSQMQVNWKQRYSHWKYKDFWKTMRGAQNRNLDKPISDLDDEANAEQTLNRILHQHDFDRCRIIGQFNRSFILIALDGNIFIIDQHAADEKYNFERLNSSVKIESQPLIIPRKIQLPVTDELIAMSNREILAKNGFEICVDDGATPTERISIVQQPVIGQRSLDYKDFEELVSLLRDTKDTTVRCSKVRAIFASRACRSSVMVGHALDKRQMRNIVTHMGTMKQPWNCPHGRPTCRFVGCL